MTRRPPARAVTRAGALVRAMVCAALAIDGLIGGCATSGSTASAPSTARKYPPRSVGCELAFFHTAVPGVPAWDDLGIAEAACNIDESTAECLRQLRADACRMGGDIVYNVPRRPLRPKDQVVLFRGQVAHSRSNQAQVQSDGTDLPPPASAEESARPVVPLGATDFSAEAPPPTPPPPLPAGFDLRLRAPSAPIAPSNRVTASPVDAGAAPEAPTDAISAPGREEHG